MKINKYALLFLVPLVVETLLSCCNCMGLDLNFFYSNKAFKAIHLDNSGPNPIETAANEVNKNAYGIRINMEAAKTACVSPRNPSIFWASAYATSCECQPDSTFSAKDWIVLIKIKTVNDFDEKHLAGSDVTDYFKVYEKPNFKEIGTFLKENETIFIDDMPMKYNIDLLLMSAPLKGKEHIFNIELTLSNGNVLSQQTKAINLI
jgi:hypothetical protein